MTTSQLLLPAPSSDPTLEAYLAGMGQPYRDRVKIATARDHLGLMADLSPQRLCRISARPEGDNTLEVTFAAYDFIGELAILCGLLTAEGFTVINGAAYTGEDQASTASALGAAMPLGLTSLPPGVEVEGSTAAGDITRTAGPRMTGPRTAGPRMTGPRMTGPRMTGPTRDTAEWHRRRQQAMRAAQASQVTTAPALSRRRILDTFRVRPLDPLRPPTDWAAVEGRLDALLRLVATGQWKAARESLIEPVCETIRRFWPLGVAPSLAEPIPQVGGNPLVDLRIDLDNNSDPATTIIRIESADTPAFLFQLLTAFAMRGIYVRSMDIDTRRGRAIDVLAVTDAHFAKLDLSDGGEELRAAVALIKQFSHLLPTCPNPPLALRNFATFLDQLLKSPDWPDELAQLRRPAALTALAGLMGVSEFLWDDFLRIQHRHLLPVMTSLTDSPNARRWSQDELLDDLALHTAHSAERVRVLNEWKDRQMFRIDMRHILHCSANPVTVTGGAVGATPRESAADTHFIEFSAEMTDLAEVVVRRLFDWAVEDLTASYGHPKLADGQPCRLALAALGKTGGREMGVASDIEILLLYEGQGTTAPQPGQHDAMGGAAAAQAPWVSEWGLPEDAAPPSTGPAHASKPAGQPITNAEFAAGVVRAISTGLVSRREGLFEIDLRLRPHGEDGPTAVEMATFAEYYGPGGPAPALQRQALVRFRPIAGDPLFCREALRLRDRVLYEGDPLDMVELRRLRARQLTELVAPGTLNAKYSAGGLVDIEYTVQALQVVYGRAAPAVRNPNTLMALAALRAERRLSGDVADHLRESYLFLRRLIDALRVVRGQARDLCLPPRESDQFAWLARRMGYAPDRPQETARRFADQLRRTMAFVWTLTDEIARREFPAAVKAVAIASPTPLI